MEHMLSHQQMALDEGAACFVIYSVGLVFDRLGPKRAQAVINTAIRELERLQAQADEDIVQ